MGKRPKFNKDRFMYGYAGEVIVQQTFPGCKKQSGTCPDFKHKDYFIEVGRSRILEKQVIVYYRKLFYNVKKEFHKNDKKIEPDVYLNRLREKGKDRFVCPPHKCLFVYFTRNLKYFILFDYGDILSSNLFKKPDGEYYFKVKGKKLYPSKDLYRIVGDRMGIKKPKPKIKRSDFGAYLK